MAQTLKPIQQIHHGMSWEWRRFCPRGSNCFWGTKKVLVKTSMMMDSVLGKSCKIRLGFAHRLLNFPGPHTCTVYKTIFCQGQGGYMSRCCKQTMGKFVVFKHLPLSPCANLKWLESLLSGFLLPQVQSIPCLQHRWSCYRDSKIWISYPRNPT